MKYFKIYTVYGKKLEIESFKNNHEFIFSVLSIFETTADFCTFAGSF